MLMWLAMCFFCNSGLQLHGLLNDLRSFPEAARRALSSPSSGVTVDDILAFYKVSYSEEEDKKRKEAKVIFNFTRQLKKIESKKVGFCNG